MTSTRRRQLSRIYQRTFESDEDARAAVNDDPGVLAHALFLEAVNSDDVTSIETARSYLASRLAELEPAVGGAAARVSALFEERLDAWRDDHRHSRLPKPPVSSG